MECYERHTDYLQLRLSEILHHGFTIKYLTKIPAQKISINFTVYVTAS